MVTLRLPKQRSHLLFALVLGAASVFAFAPFELPALSIVTLGLLLLHWQRASPADAAWSGFAFGLGFFGAGVAWVYIALNTFGGMAWPIAAIATLGFCALLALHPALAGWIATRWTPPDSILRVLVAAGTWTLSEWVRSWLFTGFPWLALGYSALPQDGPTALAGVAPLGGVFAVSLVMALIAALLALAIGALERSAWRRLAGLAACALALVAAPAALRSLEWTTPVGTPVAVSLLQGNVGQDLKFDPALQDEQYKLYTEMARASLGQLVVLPESAFPVFADEVPDAVVRDLFDVAAERDGDVLAGMFTAEPPLPGSTLPRYYNSVLALGHGGVQVYRKRHLVPFGETIPLESILGWFIRSVLSIPLASQASGAPDQPPFLTAGQRVAVNICYEDVFGADIRPQAAHSTLLVNVTNDAWYGRSLAARQHNQIAAMRALESGRPLLRATNTGITSAFDHHGREIARLPWFTRAILEVTVVGREGTTPYVRAGDAVAVVAALIIVALGLGGAVWQTRARRRSPQARSP